MKFHPYEKGGRASGNSFSHAEEGGGGETQKVMG